VVVALSGSTGWYQRLLILLSIAGFLLVLHSTTTGGLSLSSDAVNYLAAARSFVSGSGLLRFHGDPLVQWGPVYPLFLAGLDVISRALPIDFIETIRFANAVLYGITIYISGRLFQRYLRLQAAALLAVIWIGGSEVLLRRTIFPLSEQLFVLLTLLIILYWPRILGPSARRRDYVIFGALLALVPLLRFVGYSLIPLAMLSIVLFQQRRTLIQRIWLAAAFALTSLPFIIWVLYGQTTADYRRLRGDPFTLISDNLNRAPRLLANWFVPPEFATSLTDLLVVAVIVIVIVWVSWHYYRAIRAAGVYPDLYTYPLLVALYVPVYFLGMIAAFVSSRQPIDARHMSVLYPFVILLLFYAFERLLLRTKTRTQAAALVLAAGILTVHPLSRGYAFMTWSVTYCCRGAFDREGEMIQWLRQHSLGPGRFYSNTPLPIMYTDVRVLAVPQTLEGLRRTFASGEDVYLIWFAGDELSDTINRPAPHFYALEYDPFELADAAEITVIAELADGQILRFRPVEQGQTA
jgi:hypothetical protein